MTPPVPRGSRELTPDGGECKSKPEWQPGKPVAKEAGTHVREDWESRLPSGDGRMSINHGEALVIGLLELYLLCVIVAVA